MIDNVIFDFDGTLVDSADDIIGCFKKAYSEAGVPLPRRNMRSLMGPPLIKMISLISPGLKKDKAGLIANKFKEYYDKDEYANTKLFHGVEALLHNLRQRGIRIYIVTNKRMYPTIRILKKYNAMKYFKYIYAADMRKGNLLKKSDLLLKLIRRAKLDLNKTMYVGDMESDIVAAKENGLVTVAFLGGYGAKNALLKQRPSYTITQMPELINIFSRT